MTRIFHGFSNFTEFEDKIIENWDEIKDLENRERERFFQIEAKHITTKDPLFKN